MSVPRRGDTAFLAPEYAREIVEAKVDPQTYKQVQAAGYKLFGMDCPQPVMAAYERCWARRGNPLQMDTDLLIGWAVETALKKGDFQLAGDLRDAFERLGWRPSV